MPGQGLETDDGVQEDHSSVAERLHPVTDELFAYKIFLKSSIQDRNT